MSVPSLSAKRLHVSPLRYPGGKGALFPRLRNLIRRMDLSNGVYIEPFSGGAGAAVALLVTGQVRQIAINDLDPTIFAFWKMMVSEPKYVLDRIQHVPLTVEEWRRQKEIFNDQDTTDPLSLGFATFYLNRTNRSGVLNGGPIGGLDQSGNYKIDARFNRATLAERVRIIALYASSILVSCQDGAEIIRSYGARSDAFIYADPPYFQKAGTLYMNAFDDESHERLACTLNAMPDTNWLLTYDHEPRVAELYPDRRRRTFELNYSAHRIARARETVILSDAMPEVADGWPV